jgi:hypothetical protein
MRTSPTKSSHAQRQGTLIETTSSRLQRLFSQTTWRRWLEKLQQFEEAMHITELDVIETRVRNLEAQISLAASAARIPG